MSSWPVWSPDVSHPELHGPSGAAAVAGTSWTTSEFDTNYMNQEFNLAYNLARSGCKWSKYPPGFEPHLPGRLQVHKVDDGFLGYAI